MLEATALGSFASQFCGHERNSRGTRFNGIAPPSHADGRGCNPYSVHCCTLLGWRRAGHACPGNSKKSIQRKDARFSEFKTDARVNAQFCANHNVCIHPQPSFNVHFESLPEEMVCPKQVLQACKHW